MRRSSCLCILLLRSQMLRSCCDNVFCLKFPFLFQVLSVLAHPRGVSGLYICFGVCLASLSASSFLSSQCLDPFRFSPSQSTPSSFCLAVSICPVSVLSRRLDLPVSILSRRLDLSSLSCLDASIRPVSVLSRCLDCRRSVSVCPLLSRLPISVL